VGLERLSLAVLETVTVRRNSLSRRLLSHLTNHTPLLKILPAVSSHVLEFDEVICYLSDSYCDVI